MVKDLNGKFVSNFELSEHPHMKRSSQALGKLATCIIIPPSTNHD